ncbi:zinc finger protein ZFP2-like [Palaemon carinicauda]|uniref:zinc finger protein ZFP2-like n=1 Tax=Palaemon carinicauda TaxID=392227 RepID=UPI0035B66F94
MEKVYVCKECNKTFPKYYDLRRHNKLHTGEHPFMCEICGLGFTDNNRLIIHVGRDHTGRKPFECSVCDKAFCRSSDLNRHMKVHDKERLLVDHQILDQTLECTISEKDTGVSLNSDIEGSPFHNQSLSEEREKAFQVLEDDKNCHLNNTVSHFLLSRDSPIYLEGKRGLECTDLDQNCDIKPHETLGTSEETPVYIDDNLLGMASPQTDKGAADTGDLKLQFPIEAPYLDERIFDLTDFNKSVPNSSESKQTGVAIQNIGRRQMASNTGEKAKLGLYTGDRPYLGRPFECKYCEKSFTKSSDLKRHLMIHTGDRPFVCNLCGTGFIEKSKLIVHTRHHTGERPFECQDCGKTFIKKSDMTNHRKTHSGERNFVCCECGKAFIKKSDLTRHTRLHTGERPYVCVVCGAAFTESGKLKKHTIVHTGEKNVQCDTCGKRFAKNSDLRRHTRIHTGERPYVCTLCSKSFTYSQMLKEHLKKEHNITTLASNQSLQHTQFADVVDSINSSIVNPALAFLVNQNQKTQENHQFDVQTNENSGNQPSGTAESMKSNLSSKSEAGESGNMSKWNTENPENTNYPTFSRVDSELLNVQSANNFTDSSLCIKEEMMPVEENN